MPAELPNIALRGAPPGRTPPSARRGDSAHGFVTAPLQRATVTPYPFTAVVAQEEARLALLLAAINPRVGGVLLSGPKGIGKTSIVRGIAGLLPNLVRAACPYGCEPGGSALCESCAAGTTAGRPRNSARRDRGVAGQRANR